MQNLKIQVQHIHFHDKYQSIKMIQLAALRPLIAVSEHLPQFMITYLDEMLSSTCIPSMALRRITSDDDIPVNLDESHRDAC